MYGAFGPDNETADAFFANRRIIVTGAAGTVGSELVRWLLRTSAAEVRGIDSHENGLFFLAEALRHEPRFHPFICDVRNLRKLSHMFIGMDYCIHTAALKHVGSSERSPFETVQTNIIGVQNVIQAALDNGTERVLLTSSDKAVNPTNVMGTTKLMGERLITAANAMLGLGSKAVFASVRFGNVAGSAGSVVPLFCEQIAAGGPVTLTDPQMTRFVMTLQEAVRLVLKSLRIAQGGEVFVTRMPVIRIVDLVAGLIDLVAPLYGHNPAKIELRCIGPRPGEKLYEELTTDEELRRTLELDELFAVLPAFRNIYNGIDYSYPVSRAAERTHNSANEPPVTRAYLREFLLQPGVLPRHVVDLLASKPAGNAHDQTQTGISLAPLRDRIAELKPAILDPQFARATPAVHGPSRLDA
jgi:FlaA1/EpsC-like NDP-sugar epimerase